MKLVKKVVVTFFSVLIMCQGLNASTNSNLEAVYDNKIKEIQALQGTYVIGNAIGDFNGDGIRELVVSQLTTYSAEGECANIMNIAFTYKNGKLERISNNSEMKNIVVPAEIASGNGTPSGLVAQVSSLDGKKSLIKVCSGSSYGEEVIYFKLDENGNWKKYLSSSTKHREGYGDDEWYKNNTKITKEQYKKEISYYPNMNTLYVYTRDGKIKSKANKYNKVQVETPIGNVSTDKSCNIYLSYEKAPCLTSFNNTPIKFDLE